MIRRILSEEITRSLQEDHKIIVLYGARQVGKSTLIENVLDDLKSKVVTANGDELIYHEVFSSRNLSLMKDFVDGADVLYLDEAQRIKNVGINLKILHDALPALKIIITGSSSLDLASDVKEPLTGRTQSHILYPISLEELRTQYSRFELRQELDQYLCYGMYPEILMTTGGKQKIQRLRELASSYLYKDILMLTNIRNSDKLFKLLQLLAYQIGQPVSVHELARTLGLSSETVNHYIDLMEKSFVVFRLSGYSNNPRKEVSKMNKIYFYDLGIRNTLIDNFQSLDIRPDKGAVFENFFIMEKIKRSSYTNDYARHYFWRTYGGAEIDFIESRDNQLHGYEIKANRKSKNPPKSWIENYENSTFYSVHLENYLDFILD